MLSLQKALQHTVVFVVFSLYQLVAYMVVGKFGADIFKNPST